MIHVITMILTLVDIFVHRQIIVTHQSSQSHKLVVWFDTQAWKLLLTNQACRIHHSSDILFLLTLI